MVPESELPPLIAAKGGRLPMVATTGALPERFDGGAGPPLPPTQRAGREAGYNP